MTAKELTTERRGSTAATTAASWGLRVLLLASVTVFGCWVVGTRSLEMGADTSVYAGFFESLGHGPVETRMERGFVGVSYLLKRLGLGVIGYQAALFALLLFTVWVASRRYFKFLGDTRGYLTFLSASLTLLFISPMFANASINAIRQGLAALLIFAALLAFRQRSWWYFAICGAVALSMHLSSALYLLLAPALLFSARTLRFTAAIAFLVYCTGLSRLLVQSLAPSLYSMVMDYVATSEYRSGVRLDFAVFSIFWYVLPYFASSLIKSPYREKVQESTAVYLVMLLPFFAVGWGNFSNRYLLPGWLAVSLIMAAIVFHSRLRVLRDPLMIHFGLLVSCGVFYFYVTNGIVI